MQHDRPFRLRVQDALTAALEAITPANGYTNDLSQSVFRGRDTFGDDDPLPMVAILEPPVEPDQLETFSGHETSANWDLLLQGFVDSDLTATRHPTDPAHFLLADLKKALIKEKMRDDGFNALGFDGRVYVVKIGQGVVRPADDVSAKAYVLLPIVLRIAENHQDPFA